MSDLLAELAKMTGGQWTACVSLVAFWFLLGGAMWSEWVIPFEVRVTREIAQRAAGARHERNEV
jgi:hypothetical protein